MLNIGVIGIGNCGNQIALLAHKEADCEVYAINSSENDLATLPDDIPKRLVGDSEGTGKNRADAKKFLKKAAMELVTDETFKNFIFTKDVIMIASSTGGGTGSGMSPVLSSIIRSSFKNPDGTNKIVILVGVLPKLSEGYSTQVNSLAYAHEVFDVLKDATYMFYDNNKYNKETAFVVLQKVNQEVVEDIKIMQCRYNASTQYDSIDEKDMKTILNAPGLISTAAVRGIKEKDLDETTIEDLIIDAMKKNAHAEIQRDGVIQNTGLITNLNEKLNETFDSHIENVRKFVGEPIEEFLHISVNTDRSLPNNVFVILTGLSKIQDRFDKIRDRIEEIDEKKRVSEEELDVDSAISSEEIEEMNAKRNRRTENTEDTNVNLKSIFEEFDA